MASSESSLTKQFLRVEWQSIEIEKRKFLFKSLFEVNEFEILLFDLNNFELFHLKNDEFEIKENFLILNPKSESPTDILVEHLKNSFNSKSELKILSGPNREKLKIKLTGVFAGQKNFNWLFEFSSLDLIQLRDHLVFPLLFNLCESQQREKELIEIIKQKDKELDDYKSQGCNLTRKYLQTNNFENNVFEESMKNKANDEAITNPFEILKSDYLSKIETTCINKYYKIFFELDKRKKVEHNILNIEEKIAQFESQNDKKPELEKNSSQDDIFVKKQKEQIERDKREKQLEKEIEEVAKKKARQEQNKKKKLMK